MFPLTITSIMDFADRVHGDSEIVSITSDSSSHRYTFRDAFERTRKLANALAGAGVESGDRIATLAWNDYRHYELYYAISCSGAVCHTIIRACSPSRSSTSSITPRTDWCLSTRLLCLLWNNFRID